MSAVRRSSRDRKPSAKAVEAARLNSDTEKPTSREATAPRSTAKPKEARGTRKQKTQVPKLNHLKTKYNTNL